MGTTVCGAVNGRDSRISNAVATRRATRRRNMASGSPAPTAFFLHTESDREIRRVLNAGALRAPEVPDTIAGEVKGGGSPLPEAERAFFEPRFGRDFAGVRVHTGETAAGLSASINAMAFTIGNDIAFGKGRYRPGTPEGRRLLGHELVHVTQQRSGATALIQRLTDPIVTYRRDRAQACLVHLHRSERQALANALELKDTYCVNLVHIGENGDEHGGDEDRYITVDVIMQDGVTHQCKADPNRIFGRDGIVNEFDEWNDGDTAVESGNSREWAILTIIDYGRELSNQIDLCGSSMQEQSGGDNPIFALHNYRTRTIQRGGTERRVSIFNSYLPANQTETNRATAMPDRPEDRERLVRIYLRLAGDSRMSGRMPRQCRSAGDTPSDRCLESINPFVRGRSNNDFILVTREDDFVALVLRETGCNVILQAANPTDDGSLSVARSDQRYLNLETARDEGRDASLPLAVIGIDLLGVGTDCPPPVQNTIVPTLEDHTSVTVPSEGG